LQIEWDEVVSKEKLNYIMGNPPFVGARLMEREQKDDIVRMFSKYSNLGIGKLDYVCGWYLKACEYIQNTEIKCAFVSTNSITQGEIIGYFWTILLKFNIKIIFAYKSFIWNSESNSQAHVHCVIIGFSSSSKDIRKLLFEDNTHYKKVNKINPYLIEGENIIISNRANPISKCSLITTGSQPTDDGNLLFDKDEANDFVLKEPLAKKYIKKIVGSNEFINNINRYCLWLIDCPPNELRQMPLVLERIKKVKEFRLQSSKEGTRKKAETPTLFDEIRQPSTQYLAIPKVSSEKRKYIPIGYMDRNIIAKNQLLIIPNATLYEFGIITSNVHMAWVRTTCGRMKSDYTYSAGICYNNFPWPNSTETQKQKIEKTAQEILDARKLYPDCSLADLYDEVAMPPELRKAHQNNDKAVMEAYGFPVKNTFTESHCVAEIMKMYQKIVEN